MTSKLHINMDLVPVQNLLSIPNSVVEDKIEMTEDRQRRTHDREQVESMTTNELQRGQELHGQRDAR